MCRVKKCVSVVSGGPGAIDDLSFRMPWDFPVDTPCDAVAAANALRGKIQKRLAKKGYQSTSIEVEKKEVIYSMDPSVVAYFEAYVGLLVRSDQIG